MVTLDPTKFPQGQDNTVLLQKFLDDNAGTTINWVPNVYITHDRPLTNPANTKIVGWLDDDGSPNCGTRLLTDTGGYTNFDAQRVRNSWNVRSGSTLKNFNPLGHKDPTKGRSPTVVDPATGKTYRNVWEGQSGVNCEGVKDVTLCTVWAEHHWGDGFAIAASGSGTSVQNSDSIDIRYCRSYDTGRMAFLLNGVSNLEVWNWEAEKYASGCFHTEMSANQLQDQNNWQIRDGHDYGGGDFVHCSSGQLLAGVQITGNLISGQFRLFAAGKTQPDGSKGYQHWNVSNNVWTVASGELMNLWNFDGFTFQGNVGYILKGRAYADPDGLKTCINTRILPSENKITTV